MHKTYAIVRMENLKLVDLDGCKQVVRPFVKYNIESVNRKEETCIIKLINGSQVKLKKDQFSTVKTYGNRL